MKKMKMQAGKNKCSKKKKTVKKHKWMKRRKYDYGEKKQDKRKLNISMLAVKTIILMTE